MQVPSRQAWGEGLRRHQSEDPEGRPFRPQMLTAHYVLVPALGVYHMAGVQL